MGENITSNIINNYSKHILKPLDNNNVNNSCWINSALYLISAHPYIMFQYLLLDNSRLTEKDKKIYNDIYFKNIIYNYKYIKSEKNINSKILYNEELHKKLYKKIKFNNLFDVPNIWGNTWDAIPTIDLLFTIITKKHSIINTNMYLTIEGRILKNYKDIDKLLKIKDGITTEKDKLLLGFITGTKCNKYDKGVWVRCFNCFVTFTKCIHYSRASEYLISLVTSIFRCANSQSNICSNISYT